MALSMLLAVLSLAAGPPAAPPAGPQFEVQPLAGPAVTGRLVAIDAAQLTLSTSGGSQSLPLAGVMSISAKEQPKAPFAPAAWIDLRDGSALVGSGFTTSGSKAQIALGGADSLELPLAGVAAVRFRPLTAAAGNEWAKLLAKKATTDLLVLAKDDATDDHQGVIRGVSDKAVDFEVEGEVVPVKRAKIFGLIYRGLDQEQPEPLCWVTDAAGSRWAARSLGLPGKVQWTTVGGAALNRPLEQIVKIDLSQGKIVYLSDLKPDSTTYTPFFPLKDELPARLQFFRLREDQNLESKPLRLDGKEYHKGLAMHSRTEVVYSLPGRFRRFQTTAGIDDSVRPQGGVRLVVRGDDKLLLETVLTGAKPAQATDHADIAQAIDIDVTGVRRLTILADFSNESDVAGHVILGDARVSK